MKYLIFIFFNCLTFQLFSQAYQPFPMSDASWRVDFCDGYNCSINCYCHTDQYNAVGDTIINDTLYTKIESWYGNTVGPTYNEPLYLSFLGYNGAIRNDSVGKKVYFRGTKDTLLFDFNLQIGDTVPATLIHYSQDTLVVRFIDSVLIGNKYHKKYLLSPSPLDNHITGDLVEGVGSNCGLLERLIRSFFESGYELKCFRDGGNFYPPYNVFSCSMLDGISEKDYKTSKFKIHPNPFNSQTHIQIPSYIKSPSFQALDIYGNLINLKTKNNGENEIIIDRGNLPAGIYLLQIFDKNSIAGFEKMMIY